MSQKVLIVMADGFEDVEAVTPIDILRRANLDVTVAGLDKEIITGARGTKIQTDIVFDKILDFNFDILVLPGGTRGAENLAASKKINKLIMEMNQKKKLIAAICASPALVLSPTGILKNKKATCFPGLENRFSEFTTHLEDSVVVDGNIITSRALGTALPFSLKLVEILCGKDVSKKISRSVLF